MHSAFCRYLKRESKCNYPRVIIAYRFEPTTSCGALVPNTLKRVRVVLESFLARSLYPRVLFMVGMQQPEKTDLGAAARETAHPS